MKRINAKAVELNEAEHVLQEWHDSLMDVGYGPQTALKKMFNVTSPQSETWKLLNQQDFRDYLATTKTMVASGGEMPTVYVLSAGEADVIEELRLKSAEVLDRIPEICGATYQTGGNDPYSTECYLKPNHPETYHEGDDPMDAANLRVRWNGGGSCAGDRLPITNVQYIPKETAE